jgi:hypothetical protein
MAIVVGASDMSVKEKRVQKSFLKGEKIPVGAETTNPLLMVVLDEMRGARQDSLVDCSHWRYKKLEFTGEVKATKDVTLYGKAVE